MSQVKKLEKYLQSNLIEYEIEDECVIIDGNIYNIISDDVQIVDEDMVFLPTLPFEMINGYVYEFGGRWYIQEHEEEELQMIELIYLGKAKQKLPTKTFLGIRSSYELMNGMGLYKDWIRKAKFLGVETLGICEHSTLSGALVFQNECQQNRIKSIIGMTIPVKGGLTFDMKVYAKNFQGWLNLLKFNSKLNVDGENYIERQFLIDNREGLILVADPKSMNFSEVEYMDKSFILYQLDTVNFLNEEKDQWYIENLEKFILSNLEPIAITDAFYLEQNHFEIREALWTINKSFDDRTNNQYFKNSDQYAKELISMFEEGNKSWIKLFKEANKNLECLEIQCNFIYDTDTRHLPKYVMTESEQKQFQTNDALFLHLIKEGFKKLPAQLDQQKYIDRIKKEVEVLKQGDTIDYFLILWDIVKHAKEQDMLTGIGRGSAGGSLVAYLLGIIHIDPLEFDLLFERFLNSGRMGKFEDRPNYIFESEDGRTIELAEGELARVLRDGEEKVLYCHEIREGDEIIKY